VTGSFWWDLLLGIAAALLLAWIALVIGLALESVLNLDGLTDQIAT